MYISGGSNVYPLEIEEAIRMHPAIAEAAVVGMPDPVWGEVGVAVCVKRDAVNVSETELLLWLRQRIAPYKIPKIISFHDTLPRSAYGKITKADLRLMLGRGES
jgi:acyl-CoA synthetase (AMP-forming)/AMP-acid ligase II